MVRGKHAIQPDRKAQAKKAGAVLTAIVMTGSATTEAAAALPAIQDLHTDAASSAPTSSDQVSQKTSVPQADATDQADQTITADPDESLNQTMPARGEFAENPGTPLPSSISDALPSDAQLVGTQYAQTPDGTIYNVSDGQKTTDPRIVGTADQPADPLAKSDGVHFIPVPVGTARREVADWERTNHSGQTAGNASQASGERHTTTTSSFVTSAGDHDDVVRGKVNRDFIPSAKLGEDLAVRRQNVRLASNFSGWYDAHWGTIGSEQAFFNRLNQPVIRQAKKGIDVSEWQGDINWAAARNSGVETAIIRTNAGSGHVDKKADRNLQECLRRGIPFGAYMYSYASNGAEARAEAQVTVRMLRGNGVTPNRLALPVYLDLENFPGHPGTAAYEDVVRSWIDEMHRNGYTNVSVYSFTSYLSSTLNSRYIHSQVGWVAQYAGGLQYTAFSGNARGWQYSSSGRIDGIAGNVDLDAFGYGTPAVPYIQSRRILRIPDGEYYINSALDSAVSVEIPGGATSNGNHRAHLRRQRHRIAALPLHPQRGRYLYHREHALGQGAGCSRRLRR